ncbi:alpha/beta fold hydrolase [Nordella sp. HKS 07]|uniref:alpha/beta fold hydrolase n=1 Tax=Nordella sp. HKS 07 TaxID=2712222 RepID=UPI0013E14765|nr:alpha/beta fold hydrolase [Nordella sp. HKS 07]QIG48482.1 alpha/beta fold hydrolase [Nordella sp. HKS 07]
MIFRFGEYQIDTDLFELKRGADVVKVEPQVFGLLVLLIRNRHRVVSQSELLEEIWPGRSVSLSTVASRINGVRSAIGDSGAAQRIIRTIQRKGFRFVAEVSEAAENPAATRRPAETADTQDIRFCTTSDNVRIAYALAGKGRPVLKAGNWLNHLDYDWKSPIWSHLLQWLASENQLIRYDARGNGMSDWDVRDISFASYLRDLESVADASHLERFTLLGISQGCAVSIAYAVKHPERVKKLILYGGFARGRRIRGTIEEIEQAEAMITLIRTGWGQENPAFRQVFTSLLLPGGTPEQMQWFNDLQKATASPENAVRMRFVSDTLDVSSLLSQVKAPTLVLHCKGDAVQPLSEGMYIAARIPGARFVALEGRNHLILETDPGWPKFQEEVGRFLSEDEA